MENQTVARSGFSLGKRSRNQLFAGYLLQGHPTKIISQMHNNRQKNLQESDTKIFLSFLTLLEKKSVPLSQGDYEQN